MYSPVEVWKSLLIGTSKNPQTLVSKIKVDVCDSDYFRSYVPLSQRKKLVKIALVTPRDLGITETVSREKIILFATFFGLVPCRHEIGLYLALKQPIAEVQRSTITIFTNRSIRWQRRRNNIVLSQYDIALSEESPDTFEPDQKLVFAFKE